MDGTLVTIEVLFASENTIRFWEASTADPALVLRDVLSVGVHNNLVEERYVTMVLSLVMRLGKVVVMSVRY